MVIIGPALFMLISKMHIISVLIVEIPISRIIFLVPTVSLSAVFPLCLVRLVGGEYSKAKKQQYFSSGQPLSRLCCI